jgi:ABC-type amino acid transport substrate-binding protein
MFRELFLLGIAAMASIQAGAQAPLEASKPPLLIAAEDGAGPWGQADGTGCGNDLVLAAYAAVQVPVKLEVMPYSRAKHGAISGSYVACFGMAWAPELQGRIVFADRPLYTVSAVLMQSTAKPLRASETKDLKAGTRIGTVLDYEYPPAFEGLVKKGILAPMPAYSETVSLRNLAKHRVDAALVILDELKSADYLVARAGLAGRVAPAFSLGEQGTYLGFSVAHPQSEYARAKFNEGFAIIVGNGTYKKILDTWKVMPF